MSLNIKQSISNIYLFFIEVILVKTLSIVIEQLGSWQQVHKVLLSFVVFFCHCHFFSYSVKSFGFCN